jgi:hypothetical protein
VGEIIRVSDDVTCTPGGYVLVATKGERLRLMVGLNMKGPWPAVIWTLDTGISVSVTGAMIKVVVIVVATKLVPSSQPTSRVVTSGGMLTVTVDPTGSGLGARTSRAGGSA